MRVVRSTKTAADHAEYAEAVAAARREAAAAFGDDTILVERYVEHGRHVEVQVLGDAHGNLVHLFERDCSTQRRHQKVIEEAPAPTITDEVRTTITDAALALARQVGYRNAGTVEFLLDTDTGEAWFLEMNTRLQVEHAVTEAVTGLDLVRLQLMVAAGEPLPFEQADITCTGHAIEARVYAEDSFGGFLPQAGTATLVRWPANARVDAALESGQVVSTAYDPMLGKIVVHGPDRESARNQMVGALDRTAILGLTTNIGFLREIVAGVELRDATITTSWLDSAELSVPDDRVPRLLAAWTDVAVTRLATPAHPFAPDGWRLGADPAPVVVELDRPVAVDRAHGLVDGSPITELSCDSHTLVATLEGHRHEAVAIVDRHRVEVVHQGQRYVFERPGVAAAHGAAAGDGSLVAPMPGSVQSVYAELGQHVEQGTVLGVLEAMKMELAIKAPHSGTVTMVGCTVGEQVTLGATLFVVTAEED